MLKKGASAAFTRPVAQKEAPGSKAGAEATDWLMYFVVYSAVHIMLLAVCVILLSVIVGILLKS